MLTPVVTLSGQTSSGATAKTNLSSKEAAFVAGTFSKAETSTTFVAPDPPIQTLVVAADAPFIVPGTYIMIFPLGGIITGLWTIMFIATVAWGTIGRIQFRDQFRSRSARAGKIDLPRI